MLNEISDPHIMLKIKSSNFLTTAQKSTSLSGNDAPHIILDRNYFVCGLWAHGRQQLHALHYVRRNFSPLNTYFRRQISPQIVFSNFTTVYNTENGEFSGNFQPECRGTLGWRKGYADVPLNFGGKSKSREKFGNKKIVKVNFRNTEYIL
jgi:hypothetical protein